MFERPEYREQRMDAEIGSYQDDSDLPIADESGAAEAPIAE
jgi:hypothetical protein